MTCAFFVIDACLGSSTKSSFLLSETIIIVALTGVVLRNGPLGSMIAIRDSLSSSVTNATFQWQFGELTKCAYLQRITEIWKQHCFGLHSKIVVCCVLMFHTKAAGLWCGRCAIASSKRCFHCPYRRQVHPSKRFFADKMQRTIYTHLHWHARDVKSAPWRKFLKPNAASQHLVTGGKDTTQPSKL